MGILEEEIQLNIGSINIKKLEAYNSNKLSDYIAKKNPSILFVQEFPLKLESTFFDEMNVHGYSHLGYPKSKNFNRRTISCNMIFAKKKYSDLSIEWKANGDYWNKICGITVGNLNIYNIHLPSKKAIEVHSKFIKREKTIIIGDFNKGKIALQKHLGKNLPEFSVCNYTGSDVTYRNYHVNNEDSKQTETSIDHVITNIKSVNITVKRDYIPINKLYSDHAYLEITIKPTTSN